MAKRVPVDEKPYNPVEEAVVRAVLLGERAGNDAAEQERVEVAQQTAIPPQEITREETASRAKVVAMLKSEKIPQSLPHAFAKGKQAREKRVLLTYPEERRIELLVYRLAIELSTPVKLSHVLRACVTLLQHAENEIAERARRAAPLTRPPNGSAEALADFEHRLAQLLLEALRKAPPLH
jgi:hypothetical protein